VRRGHVALHTLGASSFRGSSRTANDYRQIDFVPVGTLARSSYMLVVNTKSGFKSVADVVNAAKAEPGKLTYGFWTSNVLVSNEMFAQSAGIQLRKVLYKGSAEAVADLVGGRISLIFVDINAVGSFIDAGNLRFLAATGLKRTAVLPDVPTMIEEGYPQVVTDTTTVMFAPAGTPQPILERLNAALVKVIGTSMPLREKFVSIALDPTTMNLSEVEAFVRSELTRWEGMIKKAGLEKE